MVGGWALSRSAPMEPWSPPTVRQSLAAPRALDLPRGPVDQAAPGKPHRPLSRLEIRRRLSWCRRNQLGKAADLGAGPRIPGICLQPGQYVAELRAHADGPRILIVELPGARQVSAFGKHGAFALDPGEDPDDEANRNGSQWVALAARSADLGAIADNENWSPAPCQFLGRPLDRRLFEPAGDPPSLVGYAMSPRRSRQLSAVSTTEADARGLTAQKNPGYCAARLRSSSSTCASASSFGRPGSARPMS